MNLIQSFAPELPPGGQQFPAWMPLPKLQAALHEAHKNVMAPAPLIFSGALTAMATASQGVIEVRKPNGQLVPVSLMLLSIANSGERKSTAENVFLEPVRIFQKEQNLTYLAALGEWNARLKVWEAKQKVMLKSISIKVVLDASSEIEEQGLLDHEILKPAKPKRFKILYEDSTSEALFLGLHQHLSTAGMISSEGGGILNGRAFNDLSKLNSIWSGDSITVDRKSAESYELNGARLTVSIMAQESAFATYMEHRGDASRGSGLLARFLICQPRSTQGTRLISSDTLSWVCCEKFAGRLTEVLEENIGLLSDPGRAKKVINFTPEASARWLQVFNAIESGINPGGRFFGAGDHASKLADNIARIAAVFHYFEGFEGDISLATINSAIDICLWYSDEFIRVLMPVPQVINDANELSAWLNHLRGGRVRYVRKNYIRQCCPNKLRSKDRLNGALEIHYQHGHISNYYSGTTLCLDLFPQYAPDLYPIIFPPLKVKSQNDKIQNGKTITA